MSGSQRPRRAGAGSKLAALVVAEKEPAELPIASLPVSPKRKPSKSSKAKPLAKATNRKTASSKALSTALPPIAESTSSTFCCDGGDNGTLQVSCSICSRSAHVACLGIDPDSDTDFICSSCSSTWQTPVRLLEPVWLSERSASPTGSPMQEDTNTAHSSPSSDTLPPASASPGCSTPPPASSSHPLEGNPSLPPSLTTPKRGAGKGAKTVTKCDLCLAAIIEDKEDALQCEGTCQLWFHRYCAGVSQSYFKSLVSADNPFVCLHCSQQCHHATVSELQLEVIALRTEVAELRAALEAFCTVDNSNTIASLREEVEQLNLKVQPPPDKEPAQQWSQVVRKGKGWAKDKVKGKGEKPGSNSSSASGPGTQSRNTDDGSKPPRVKIDGARKIWGTLRSTTTVAVANSLRALSNIAPTAFSIKRKFKTAPTNPKKAVRWWFVIRGEERILQQLQDAWEPVNLQTAWKLEPLYEFAKRTVESPELTHPSPEPPASHHNRSRDSEASQTATPTGSPAPSHPNIQAQSRISDSNTSEDSPFASQPPQ